MPRTKLADTARIPYNRPEAQAVFLFPFPPLFALRSRSSAIINLVNEPVPFPYFDMLLKMNFCSLALLAWASVSVAVWPLTCLVIAVICFSLTGLKELSIALADPFGVDKCDFDLEKVSSRALPACMRMHACMQVT